MFHLNRRLAWLALAAALASASAWGLKSDKQQPINIQADHADFRADASNNSNGTGIYTGHVIITQGSIMLTADKAVLHVVNNEMDTADIAGKLNARSLHAEANAKVWDFVFTGVADSLQHAFDAALAESTRNENAVVAAELLLASLLAKFQAFRFHPVQLQLQVVGQRAMDQSFFQ